MVWQKDKIALSTLRQIGVEGIVSALHDIPNGEIWNSESINDYKNYIESHGLRWSVVESLPVSEAIKYGGEDRDSLIENYITSLENLGKSRSYNSLLQLYACSRLGKDRSFSRMGRWFILTLF